MKDSYALRAAKGKLLFNLAPGDQVLLRDFIPGKSR